MKEYLFQCRTATHGLPWEYRAHFTSHAMALEYGSKIALAFASCNWFMALDVWAMPEQSRVGDIRLNAPTSTIRSE